MASSLMKRCHEVITDTQKLTRTLKRLERTGDIAVSWGQISRADMNVVEKPHLEKYVDAIVDELFLQLLVSGIRYDLVAGIPTGGTRWAQALIERAQQFSLDVRPLTVRKLDGKYHIKDTPEPGRSRVLVVDDTIFKGLTTKDVVLKLTLAGFYVTALAFPVEMGTEGSRYWSQQAVPVVSVFNTQFIRTHR